MLRVVINLFLLTNSQRQNQLVQPANTKRQTTPKQTAKRNPKFAVLAAVADIFPNNFRKQGTNCTNKEKKRFAET
jgi:hypothetical protein